MAASPWGMPCCVDVVGDSVIVVGDYSSGIITFMDVNEGTVLRCLDGKDIKFICMCVTGDGTLIAGGDDANILQAYR